MMKIIYVQQIKECRNYSRLGLHLGPLGLFGRYRPSPATSAGTSTGSSSPFPCACGVIVLVVGIASIPAGGDGGVGGI